MKLEPSIIVHGGAGAFTSEEDATASAQACLPAARAGYALMRRGATALEAVVAAVVVLEDDPLFNAGTGSVLNVDGEVEMDAAVMDGAGGRAGAVALVRTVKNPILLARQVMERTQHLFLAGEGAVELAREVGIPEVSPASLVTEAARRKWQQARAGSRAHHTQHGTVGAVAFDGVHVAAATSTGGISLKRKGRIGDSPLIGCGTYARDGAGAVSCTGLGEAIIRAVLAKSAVDLLEQGREPLAAAQEAMPLLARCGGDGGLIIVDGRGRLAMAFNTARMTHAWIDQQGREGAAARRGP